MVCIPLWYIPYFSRSAQEDYFKNASILLLSAFVGNIWLGAFLALNLVLYIYNGSSVGYEQVLNVVFGCVLFMLSRYYFSKNKFSDMNIPVLIITFVTTLFMAMQLWHVGWLFMPMDNGGTIESGQMSDPVGFFGIKEANGTFLTIVWPIIASINPIVALFLTIPIKLSQSSSVYIAYASVVLFYTYHLHKKVFRILLFLIPIVSTVYVIGDLKTDPKTFLSRFPIWHGSVEYAFRKPWGYGPDSYRNYTKHKDFKFLSDSQYYPAIKFRVSDSEERIEYYSPTRNQKVIKERTERLKRDGIKKDEFAEWDNPHNAFINVLLQYGIIGLCLLLGLLTEIWRRFNSTKVDKELVILASCLIVYFVTSLTHFPLEIARTGYLFPILLGAFYSKTDRKVNA